MKLYTNNAAFTAPNNTGIGTSVAGAVTINAEAGIITTEALTTAIDTVFTLTLTNNKIGATDILLVTINDYSGTNGTPVLVRASTAAGSSVIKIKNIDLANALNGVLSISFCVLNQLS